MGIFGISDEIIREEETNVGSRLQARTGVQKSMNWLMGVDQYGNKRSKTQRALASGLKILAAAGVTAATGGAAAPLLAAAIGGATAAGISYGVGQNVKARAKGTAGGGATVADVSRTQRQDYVNAALYTATAGTAGMYKQGLQKGVDAAARQAGEKSVQAIIPNQGTTALAQTAGQKSSSVGSNLMSQGMIDPNIATTQTIDTGSSIVSRAGEEAVKSAPKVTYMDALRQAPKDVAKFEQKMQSKLGEYGYKIAKKQAQRGVEKGIQKIRDYKNTGFDPDGSGYYESYADNLGWAKATDKNHRGSVTEDLSGLPTNVQNQVRAKYGDDVFLVLKGKNHKSFNEAVAGEQARGYKVIKGAGGYYYSVPKNK